MNLQPPYSYYSFGVPFTDRATSRAPASDPKGQPLPAGKIGPDNWLVDATGVDTVRWNVPAHIGPCSYTIAFTGSTPKSVRVQGGTAFPVDANGRATFERTTQPPGNFLYIDIKPNGPFKFRLTREELADYPGEFDPLFLDSLAGFSPLRFMDWRGTNNNWSTEPNLVSATAAARLCNALGADMWWNVLHNQTDEAIAAEIRAIESTLSPGLSLTVEFSNEMWNTGTFQQAWTEPKKGGRPITDEEYGASVARLALILARTSPRARVVLCHQFVPRRMAKSLAAYYAAGGPPWMLKAIAVAPYLTMTSEGAVRWLAASKTDDTGEALKVITERQSLRRDDFMAFGKMARDNNCEAWLYEHGPHFTADQGGLDDASRAQLIAFNQQMAHSEPVARLFLKNIRDAEAAGFTTGCFYSHAGPGGKSGVWGAFPEAISLDGYPIARTLRVENLKRST